MMNADQSRIRMVEQQIRPWNVLDTEILGLLGKVKRELFVPTPLREMTFMETEIPLGHGAAMWLPKLEARALQTLKLRPRDRVLEVGSGSGYMTALLSRMSKHVTSVEIVPELLAFAEKNLAAQRIDNVTLVQGDAARDWEGEYDAIILTGSVPVLPEAFLSRLKPEGRLFAIVGDSPTMHAQLITKVAGGKFESATSFETVVTPLQNALQPVRFVF